MKHHYMKVSLPWASPVITDTKWLYAELVLCIAIIVYFTGLTQ